MSCSGSSLAFSATDASALAALTQAEYERGISRLWREIETAEARGERLELVSNLRLYATIGWFSP